MNTVVKWIDCKWYPNFRSNWDDTIFRNRIKHYLKPNSVILDLGAGAGIVDQMNFKNHAARVCGVDLDPRVITNPFLDEGRISDAGEIPYESESFDLVFSDNVLEHLESPLSVFQEVHRVLKPGGLFLFKTPNKWHYMPTIARITPHSFHQYMNRIRGRANVDTFPTRYKANTKFDISRLANDSNFVVQSIELIEGRPEYLRMTWITYLFGLLYEKSVNASPFFEHFRILLIGTLRKI